jgi:HSP20 family protein
MNIELYQALPCRYSLGSGSAFHPYDSFDTLTRSMSELTRYADHISRALADPKYQQEYNQALAANRQQAQEQSPSSQPYELLLRPSIDWKETTDGFVLTAATPGLRKDELKVELLEAAGVWYMEVAGQTAASSEPPKDGSQTAQPQPKPREVRRTYRSFSERVRLPQGVDREAMRASYEDGLLVVTMPRAKAEAAKRHTITIS